MRDLQKLLCVLGIGVGTSCYILYHCLLPTCIEPLDVLTFLCSAAAYLLLVCGNAGMGAKVFIGLSTLAMVPESIGRNALLGPYWSLKELGWIGILLPPAAGIVVVVTRRQTTPKAEPEDPQGGESAGAHSPPVT